MIYLLLYIIIHIIIIYYYIITYIYFIIFLLYFIIYFLYSKTRTLLLERITFISTAIESSVVVAVVLGGSVVCKLDTVDAVDDVWLLADGIVDTC